MKGFSNDNNGQLILLACISIVIALVLIGTYEYSTLDTGEKSINRENINSYYYYESIREKYSDIYKDPDHLDFEKEMKEFALLHGYSVDFICNSYNNSVIIFMDKDIRIEEELEGGLCH